MSLFMFIRTQFLAERMLGRKTSPKSLLSRTKASAFGWIEEPCADGVVVIAISLFTKVPGSIPDRGKKRRFLTIRLFVHAVHLSSFLWRSDPFRGITSSLGEPSSDGQKPHWVIECFLPKLSPAFFNNYVQCTSV